MRQQFALALARGVVRLGDLFALLLKCGRLFHPLGLIGFRVRLPLQAVAVWGGRGLFGHKLSKSHLVAPAGPCQQVFISAPIGGIISLWMGP
ncbi:hypothetical protein PHAMO_490010 [Magnetospirillum molischianum DSM 120]|uniref:Uncharacterized protein n=1 Tax=Magnetospirillum molischianum DSM 120 TaxID=1150626 RepID=H8FWV9_MAGML|nr:hypothetical protein PHAMO_490010 [Magnetospirillum molischianum DSM 120]